MSKQKDAFLAYEADQWFKRNKDVITNYNKDNDPIIDLILRYNLTFNSVVEIGSSAGYRLDRIKKKFNADILIGVEPSKEAIAYGKANFSAVKFINTTMKNTKFFKRGVLYKLYTIKKVDDNVIYTFKVGNELKDITFSTFEQADEWLENIQV